MLCWAQLHAGEATKVALASQGHNHKPTSSRESSEGKQKGPFDDTEQYSTTYSGDKIYVRIRDWRGKNNILLPAVTDRVIEKAWLLDSGATVRVDQAPWGLVIVVPEEQCPKDADTIVVLEVPGDISDLIQPRPLEGSPSQAILLQGDTAKLGGGLHYSSGPDWIDHWTNLADSITWKVKVPVAVETTVEMTYSCAPGCGGAQFELATDKSKLIGTLRETAGMWKGWQNFERRPIPGTFRLMAGENLITLRALKKGTADEILRLYGVYLLSPQARQASAAASKSAQKERVDAGWLREAKYGLMVHWLPNSMPQTGPKKDFCQAVRDFDVQRFAGMAKDAGAGYVIFTLAQRQYFSAPFQSVDKVLPGRTCKDRDLPGDLADVLAANGIKLILYHHHGVGDTEWCER